MKTLLILQLFLSIVSYLNWEMYIDSHEEDKIADVFIWLLFLLTAINFMFLVIFAIVVYF